MKDISIEKVLGIALKAYEKSIIENYPNKEDLFEIVCNLKLLSNATDNKKEKLRQAIKNKREVNKVAYFLSRFGHESLIPLNQSKTIKKIAEMLGIKPTTLKLTRDRFDPFFDNGRNGIGQGLLPLELQEVFDSYKNIEKDEILQEIKTILKLV